MVHIKHVADQVLPGASARFTRASDGGYYWPHIHVVLDQALYAATEGREVMAKLGPRPGPSLRADALHPSVWDAATTLWRSSTTTRRIAAAAVA